MELCNQKMRKENSVVRKILDAKIPWNNYPNYKILKTNKIRAYYILHIVDNELKISHLSAPQIASIITKKFKKTILQQAIRIVLDKEIGNGVDTIKEDGVIKYHLLPNGIKEIPDIEVKKEVVFHPKDIIIPFELFESSKGYIKKVVHQINGCYKDEYFDACYVMIRRLFETLIIDVYEKKRLEDKIKQKDGSFLMLRDLIKMSINDKDIKLSSQTKNHLPKIKLLGDVGAHSRKINLRKHDIEKYSDHLRLCADELNTELNEN